MRRPDVITAPPFSEIEAESISDALDITFYFGHHRTAENAEPVMPYIARADVVIPEQGGWTEDALVAANAYAATREQKGHMSPSMRGRAVDWAQHLHTYGGYAQALFKPLRNSGKTIQFIDVPLGHRLTREAGEDNNYFGSRMVRGSQSGNFDTDLRTYSKEFDKLSRHFYDREQVIRSNLRNVLLSLVDIEEGAQDSHQGYVQDELLGFNEAEEDKPDKKQVLVILGGAHSITGDWLVEQGVRTAYAVSSDTLVDDYASLVQLAMQGEKPTKQQYAKGLLTGLFASAAGNYITAAHEQGIETLSKVALSRYFSDGFSLEDLGALWQGPDETLGERFDAIKAKNGLTDYDYLLNNVDAH